jgi:serine/threonine-protein phosphatase PP1 catalytic subunit
VEDLIRQVLDRKKHKVTGKKVLLSEPEIGQLYNAAKVVFLSQSNLLDFEAPINVWGERSILADVLSCRRGTEACLW